MYKWRKWRLWKKSSFPVDVNCIYSQLYLPPFCHNSCLFFVLRGLTLLDDIHQHHDHLPNNVLVPPFSVKTVLSHWGMESSRPLNVYLHQDVPNRSFKSLQGGAFVDWTCLSSMSHRFLNEDHDNTSNSLSYSSIHFWTIFLCASVRCTASSSLPSCPTTISRLATWCEKGHNHQTRPPFSIVLWSSSDTHGPHCSGCIGQHGNHDRSAGNDILNKLRCTVYSDIFLSEIAWTF